VKLASHDMISLGVTANVTMHYFLSVYLWSYAKTWQSRVIFAVPE
jgi:hypothetical protein